MKPIATTLLMVIILAFWSFDVYAQFAGGSGTEDDPGQIATIEQLQQIKYYTDRHFIQIDDIDASETKNWNDGKGFDPIGDIDTPFTGSYDGDGFEISGLTIDRGDEDYVGLFGYVGKGSSIKNTGLVNTNVSGEMDVGGLAGENKGEVRDSYAKGEVSGSGDYVGGLVGSNVGEIRDSYAEGDVSGGRFVGGLAGITHGDINNSHAEGDVSGGRVVGGLAGTTYGDINNSHAEGDVSGDGRRVGGLVGNNRSDIISAHATGDVSGSRDVGGLVGRNGTGEIRDSYAEGVVSGGRVVGGLVGGNNTGIGWKITGKIIDSYAEGEVSGEMDVGGLAGRNEGEINQSYSTAYVSGSENVGGLAGVSETINNSYWDMNTSGQNQAVGRGFPGGVSGLTTSEMTGQAAEKNMTGFSFGDIWQSVPNDYPKHIRGN